MSNLPVWARKPVIKNEEVIATNRGWMVKRTGELLKVVRDLDERLNGLSTEALESVSSIKSKADDQSISQEVDEPQEASQEDSSTVVDTKEEDENVDEVVESLEDDSKDIEQNDDQSISQEVDEPQEASQEAVEDKPATNPTKKSGRPKKSTKK